jgi:hypothetical protein
MAANLPFKMPLVGLQAQNNVAREVFPKDDSRVYIKLLRKK